MSDEEATTASPSTSLARSSARLWFAIEVTTEPRAEEAIEYALMEYGALGTETQVETEGSLVRVTGYFASRPDREFASQALSEALRIYSLPLSSVRTIEERELEERDWLGEWKTNWQPVTVGRRFVIAPPWSDIPEAPDRLIIRIEPGMAFGTGTHETTRLCLAAIEKHFSGGSFLDVGTGTGILAIAAAMLSPTATIEAYDTDGLAIAIAKENAHLNGVSDRISLHVGGIDETATASADLVCANLTADVILPLLPQLLAATCGRLVLSGILDEQVVTVERRLSELGIGEFDLEQDGEWVAIIV